MKFVFIREDISDITHLLRKMFRHSNNSVLQYLHFAFDTQPSNKTHARADLFLQNTKA